MRYRLMATYRGVPYEVGVGPSNSEVVLFAACPPPEELGFEPATGHWRKPVIRAEIDALWESRPVGIFRGEPCIVLDDPGERLHIAYLGTDAERATSLGYWQVDRGVFELLTPREEVAELTEERVEKPLRWGELAEGTGPMATYPYGTAPWPTAAPHMPDPQPAPDATADGETDPGAGGPPGDAGAEVPPAEVPPAEVVAPGVPPAEVVAAEVPAADVLAAEVPAAEVLAADALGAGSPAADASAAGAGPAGGPAAGVPHGEVPHGEVPEARVPAAEVPPAQGPPAGAPVASGPPAGARAAGRPGASTRRAKAPVSDTPLGDALLAETQRARRTAATPLASAPLAAPLADDPTVGHPAAVPRASVPPAGVSPETVAAVPVPSAVSAPADDGTQAATGTWPAYPGAGTDPYPDPISAGDALPYPDEDEPPGLPVPPGFYDPPDDALAGIVPMGDIGGRSARRQRVPTREIFCELADLASIPRGAYALETETDGAICLLPTPDGFEVFIAADGARHELRSFTEEEAAYFYLFGVLAADAVRSGALAPTVTMANPHGGTV
ncbi:MAG TPA: hypothetical protein VGF54_03260 [Streptosporangiaceae bacterium]